MDIQIRFKRRPIYGAPLELLGHLYYYTVMYGLTVKQFTGENWKYWEKLPKHLRKVQDSPEELESIITELERLADGSKERQKRRRTQIDGKWAEKEVILNAQLRSVLAALPEGLLAMGFRNVIDNKDLPQVLRIVDLEMVGKQGERVDFVEPDLLLLGKRHLLMVEVKTRGSSRSSRDYPPYQLLNYLHLVAKCHESDDTYLPKRFIHLILVPSKEPKWLEKHSEWVLDTCDDTGKLRVDPDACIMLSKKSKKKTSYNYELLKRLVSEIPIYYRSWEQLAQAFELAVQQYGDDLNSKHWQRIVGEVKELTNRAGRYK